ncbi:MAG: flagellar biosynthetic protein FliO [Candidatus Zixiibacteriota bacterium]|nr:MAG: flagellar biosynthetic protein FliO [candidate division Zixibacteria bacterium]
MRISLFLSLALAVLISINSPAQTTTVDTTLVPPATDYSPSLAGIIFKLLVSMILIVGLIYLSVYLIKKMNNRATGGGIVGDTIKIMGRTFISPKQSLYLVKIGQRYAILGATESNINMITELSEQEARDFDNRENKPLSISAGSKFADIFKGMIKR